jgi:surfeit locus 1 family protein
VKSPQKVPFKLEINWKISVFSLLFLPVLVGLGFWQLQRADEKNTLQQLLAEQQARPPVDLDPRVLTDSHEWLYRPVTVAGNPDRDHLWLLENQIQQGRPGYHLLVPLVLGGGEILLVNCGWLAANSDRTLLPELPPIPEQATLRGRLVKPSDNPLLRKQLAESWPRVILQVDTAAVQKALGKPVMPWLLQLDADSPMALRVDWRPLNMTADKHKAYAAQWFLLALALVILTLYANSNLGRRNISEP